MTWEEVVRFAAKHWLTVFFGVIWAVMMALLRRIGKRVKKDQKAERAMQAGVEALLADRLIQLHNYYNDRGYCPIYARRSAEAMYKAYHELGGNGTISDVWEHIQGMPIEKREERV
jgi:cbb3-type cytochrome oxidase subunit 3